MSFGGRGGNRGSYSNWGCGFRLDVEGDSRKKGCKVFPLVEATTY